jgi:hypothetical protein
MSEVSFLDKAKFIIKHNIHNQAPFCSFCLTTLNNSRDRNNHVKMIHENQVEGKIICQFCQKSFMSKTAIKYHVDILHSVSSSKVNCKLCNETFQHVMSLKRHMKSQHKKNPEMYQCVDCQKEFKRNDYLTVHTSLVHNAVNVAVNMVETLRQDDGSYKCKDCGEVFLGNEADKNVVAHLMKKCKSDDQFSCRKYFTIDNFSELFVCLCCWLASTP